MAQGTLKYEYEREASKSGMTSLGGLPLYMGGDCVSDIEKLEGDEGLCRIMRKALKQDLSRKERREIDKRFRKERKRTTPSESVIFRYLSKFHDKGQEKVREAKQAFIPEATENLKALMRINAGLIKFDALKPCEETATREALILTTDL
ncbi:MAG: hypothetical protein HQK88_10015 [Nitrospirae bacterium]|nr:hypothetical protein [Nitrospirota bacterium]MBF0617132.1 hypothetical protein [Nitrospirota bacterium]